VVYFRSGSRNTRALGSELRTIVNWFAGRVEAAGFARSPNTWRTFLRAVDGFSTAREHVLVVDRLSTITPDELKPLGRVNWRAVLDADPSSDDNGFLKATRLTVQQSHVVHLAVIGDYQIPPPPGIHWFFLRGLTGREETLAIGDHKSWVRKYKREVGLQLSRLAATFSPTPITAVVLWETSGGQLLRSLLEEINGAFSDLGSIVVVSEAEAELASICEEQGAIFVSLALRSLCAGVGDLLDISHGRTADKCTVPAVGGAPLSLDPADTLWLSEDVELVHLGLGQASSDDSTITFRQGGPVSWRNLHLRHDCDREVMPAVRTQLESDLRGRQTTRVNLYHAPGAGGSTVGRRLAWDIHTTYPVAILKRSTGQSTAQRVAKLAALTGNSVLLIIDGEDHSERSIDDLYDNLRTIQTPVVILQILRRFASQKTGKRQFWLESELTNIESNGFCAGFSLASPAKSRALSELSKQGSSKHKTAFFFGLTAFGTDFLGLRPYVELRTTNLTDAQRRLLVYVALAHYYGQQSVPSQAFAPLLGLPRSTEVRLAAVFDQGRHPALELLVEVRPGEWRMAHQLVALELLQQQLAPPASKERERVWKQSLSSWAKEFASFCAGGGDGVPSARLLELAHRVFVYRDNSELIGTERSAQQQFAQLVEDIPSKNGRIEVLRHLTEEFPLEAHFFGHLARMLGINGEHSEAIAAVDFALSIQKDDHVLHHVRGMILRYELRRRIGERANISELAELAAQAHTSFEAARTLDTHSEHAYVSEIQVLVEMLDYAGSGNPEGLRGVLANSSSPSFLREALQTSEELLDRVMRLFAGESPSKYVLDCQARVEQLYGDFPKALQVWDSLLTRPEVAKPPVRKQIVWTIIRRNKGAWDSLEGPEVGRITALLRDNLDEDPNDATSLRLWLRAIRHLEKSPSLDSVIERVSYWKANTNTLDAAFYLYVLNALKVLGGSKQAELDMTRALEECRNLARFRRDRSISFEWIGGEHGIKKLVHQSRLGEWVDTFWSNTKHLARLEGRISHIDSPQKGAIELGGGLEAFFVPGKGGFSSGLDENASITCNLGFSYDGPRAWAVESKSGAKSSIARSPTGS
jgi:tetratricopeptide (TPR) repeat protein